MKRLSIATFVLLALIAARLLIHPVFSPEPVHAQTRGEPFHCTVTVTTVTALTLVGAPCVAQPSESLYITDILTWSNSNGIAADSFMTLKYGVSTATVTVFWGEYMLSTAAITIQQDLQTPIRIPAGNQLYFINATAGSKFLTVDGYKGAP